MAKNEATGKFGVSDVLQEDASLKRRCLAASMTTVHAKHVQLRVEKTHTIHNLQLASLILLIHDDRFEIGKMGTRCQLDPSQAHMQLAVLGKKIHVSRGVPVKVSCEPGIEVVKRVLSLRVILQRHDPASRQVDWRRACLECHAHNNTKVRSGALDRPKKVRFALESDGARRNVMVRYVAEAENVAGFDTHDNGTYNSKHHRTGLAFVPSDQCHLVTTVLRPH